MNYARHNLSELLREHLDDPATVAGVHDALRALGTYPTLPTPKPRERPLAGEGQAS